MFNDLVSLLLFSLVPFKFSVGKAEGVAEFHGVGAAGG